MWGEPTKPTEYNEQWTRHLSSREEFRRSKTPDITEREDLVEAPEEADLIEDKEWRLTVRGSIGFPRCKLGVVVIRRGLKHTTLSLE